jgi:hypothetical protein
MQHNLSGNTVGYGATPPSFIVGGTAGVYNGGVNLGVASSAINMNAGGYDTAITIDNAVVSITKPLVVNGRDVMQELDELRDAVLLLTRHVDMEAKYPKLKELKDAYQAQLEKYKTFDALKESK